MEDTGTGEDKVSQDPDRVAKNVQTRRKFLGLIGGSAVAYGATQILRKAPAFLEELAKPPTPIEYGFTQHMYVDKEAESSLNLELFKRSVDMLAQEGQTWIRTNIWDHEACTVTEEGITYNQENLSRYAEAFAYAKEKGLKVCLVANTPVACADKPEDMYEVISSLYFQTLALRFKGLVDTWQLFNEADIHDYHTYREFPHGFHETPEWETYKKAFQRLVVAVAGNIKDMDPDVKIAVNFAASWHGDDEEDVAAGFFDGLLESYIDEIQLNYYPYLDRAAARALPRHIRFYKERYPKQRIVVGELGMSTAVGFTPEDQAVGIERALEALQDARVRPDAIFLFSLTDSSDAQATGYGLLDAQGKDKGAFKEVIEDEDLPEKGDDGE